MAPHFDSPNGPEFTLEDLKNCGWKAALEKRDEDTHGNGYGHKWTALQSAEREAQSKGDATTSKTLSLLAHISSMMLKPENRNEPFQPVAVFTDGSSAIPSDFTETEINLLEQEAPRQRQSCLPTWDRRDGRKESANGILAVCRHET